MHRRSRTVRVAGLYAVSAWVLIQVAATTFPYLGLPEAAVTVVIIACALGFPPVLAASWLLPVRGEGGEDGASHATPPSAASRAWIVAGAVVLLLAAGFAIRAFRPGVSTEGAASLAVLPFLNVGEDPESRYFSEGVTEELLNALARVDSLRVPARTSSFAFGEGEVAVQEVARRLNVSHVLQGSVRRSGEQVRITARLVDGASGYQVWSEQYDRELSDIFAVQEEIARSIVGALRIRLVGSAPLVKRYTDNLQAYDRYLRGRFLQADRSRETLFESIAMFRDALALDSTYALAWAGIADAYTFLADSHLPPTEAYPRAREAALRALELDPSLSEARGALALIRLASDWDHAGAIEDFHAALLLDPRNSFAHAYLGHTYAALRRFDEAAAAMVEAARLDPSWEFRALWLRIYTDDEGPVLDSLRAVVDAAPADPRPLDRLISLEYYAGRYDDMVVHDSIARARFGRPPATTTAAANLAVAHAASGRHAAARAILANLLARADTAYVAGDVIAGVYVHLGQPDSAFTWLEKAFRDRSAWLVFLDHMRVWDPLRGDLRFVELKRRVGLGA